MYYKISDTLINIEKLSIKDINKVIDEQNEKDARNEKSAGIQSRYLLPCILLNHVLPNILHLLPWLGNTIYTNFRDFFKIRAEKITCDHM